MNFRSILESKIDITIIKKLAKKAFGKDFDKVEENSTSALIYLKSSVKEVRYKDLVVFATNSVSYTIGDVYFLKGTYIIEVY